MKFEDFKYGNSMMRGIDKDEPVNPDDYAICDDCGEQNHIDELYPDDDDNGKHLHLCKPCWAKRSHDFSCVCGREWAQENIPLMCPFCGRTDIFPRYRDVIALIREEQRNNKLLLE